MGMFDSFFAEVDCPKCRTVSLIEFQTKSLDNSMREFRVGDKLILSDIEINYGYIRNATGECPNCNVHLKGEIRIVLNKFYGINDIKVWEIRSDDNGSATTSRKE